MIRHLAVALVAYAAGACAIDPAFAGTYSVTACGTSENSLSATNNSWVPSATHPGFLSTGSACPANAPLGGLYTADTLVGNVPEGARAEWRMTAPANTAISVLTLSRALEAGGDDDWLAYTRTDTAILESCHSGPGVSRCVTGNSLTFPASPTAATFSGLSATWATIGAYCLPNGFGCGTGFAVHQVAATLHQATVTLTDPVAPVPSQPIGPLAQSGTWLRGTTSLNGSATDLGGGVASLRLLVDGVPKTGTGQASFACDYTYAVPCPLSGSATLSLNTTTLTDGPHTVAVRADDAGGATANNGSTTPWSILVDNHAPGSPTNLTLDAAPVSGTPIGVSWTNPAQGSAAPIQTDGWELTPLDGGSDAQAGSGPAASGQLTGPTVTRAGRWTFRVWLVDAAGNQDPATAATTIVDTRPPAAPTGVAILGGAPNAQTGAWQATYTVATPQPGGAAPASVQWQVCRASAGCESGSAPQSTPGTHNISGTVTTSGIYTVTIAITDTAGRQGPGASISFSWTAPAPDADGDGLADNVDQCPTVAGAVANNGCPLDPPPVDSDGDGIVDAQDACPTVPGFASTNGCPLSIPLPPPPSTDTDRDGVPDARDLCPSAAAPGVANGCPAASPPPAAAPAHSNALRLTDPARYIATTHRVVVPVAPAAWQRTNQVRVTRGTAASAPTLIRVRPGATRLVISVRPGLRVPTRIEWRAPGTTRWLGVRISH